MGADAILMSKLLDLHLSRNIARLRKDDPMSSKFTELADRMKRTRAGWDARADKIMTGMDALDKRAATVFDSHEGALAKAEQGFAEMEAAVRDLEGGNNPPEGSASTADASFRDGERG